MNKEDELLARGWSWSKSVTGKEVWTKDAQEVSTLEDAWAIEFGCI